MEESTRALIIGLFVVAGRSQLSASELITLAATRGVSATNLKSHLSRMVADRTLTRSGARRRYLYSPSRTRRLVIESIQARLAPPPERWDGTWVVLLAPARSSSRASSLRTRRRLRFYGYRPLRPGAFARPAWPSASVCDRAATLVAEDGGVYVVGPLCGDRAMHQLLRSYRLSALERRARLLRARIERVLAEPPSGARAFALRLELGEPIARLFADDPSLPPELWGEKTALQELTAAYREIDRVLERASRPFLAQALNVVPPEAQAAG